MYGKNCHDKDCLLRGNGFCSLPSKKMFMLCERPSKREIGNIRQRLEKGEVLNLLKVH